MNMILKYRVNSTLIFFFLIFILIIRIFILDELIGMLLTSIRHDLISHLRTALLSHNENPCKRLQIHKMIFKVQQLDSL